MPRRHPPAAPVTDPHVEACDALATHFDPRLILPTSSGAWGAQDCLKVVVIYHERNALTRYAWMAMANVGLVSSAASASTAAAAVAEAIGLITQRAKPEQIPPMEQQLEHMEHERRLAALDAAPDG